MKFVSFSSGGPPRLGIVENEKCIDLASAEEAYRRAHSGSAWQVPADLKAFITGGERNLQAARRLRDFARLRDQNAAEFILPLNQVKLLTPLPNPYMLAEMERNCEAQFHQRDEPPRTYPAMTLMPDTVIGDPDGSVVFPVWSSRVTVSAQIAFVCGRRVEGIGETESEAAVFGYTLLISFADFGSVDLIQHPTERERSMNEDYGRWLDGLKPIGPWVVTREEAGPITPRSILLTVGSAQPVITSTTHMLNSPARILAVLSPAIPFYPGDVVGLGAMGSDTILSLAENVSNAIEVVAEVEGIGTLKCSSRPARDGKPDSDLSNQ